MSTETLKAQVRAHLERIYHEDNATLAESKTLFEDFINHLNPTSFPTHSPLSEENIYLITYGDSLLQAGEKPLHTLQTFAAKHLKKTITDIHILPMFPFTSDDGFSVLDYNEINPALGNWSDIANLETDFRLMFDFVANHMSKSSAWFQAFLNGEPDFKQAFIKYNPDFDSSQVTRPRTSPLFHNYTNQAGETISAWTTFSEDQVDLNARDPLTLLRLTQVLLEYAEKGASSIRLDAIGFLWKTSGTTCMHLPETHEIIKLWRTLIDFYAPHTQLITETNVPHEDNIQYFGNQTDEANQVYQFPLPPLVFHALSFHDSHYLTDWAKGIDRVSDTGTYFNFLASHDGIGMRPVENILPAEDIQSLADKVLANQGRISYKTNTDGSESIYELNINYGDALRNQDEDEVTGAKKVIAAHHILLSLVGVPAIYLHSLVGSHNDLAGLEASGINRRINREQLDYAMLEAELVENPYRHEIFTSLKNLIALRKQESAFNPYASQEVLNVSQQVFAVRRVNQQTGEIVEAYTNVSDQPQELTGISGINLMTEEALTDSLQLAPYGIAWIKK